MCHVTICPDKQTYIIYHFEVNNNFILFYSILYSILTPQIPGKDEMISMLCPAELRDIVLGWMESANFSLVEEEALTRIYSKTEIPYQADKVYSMWNLEDMIL